MVLTWPGLTLAGLARIPGASAGTAGLTAIHTVRPPPSGQPGPAQAAGKVPREQTEAWKVS